MSGFLLEVTILRKWSIGQMRSSSSSIRNRIAKNGGKWPREYPHTIIGSNDRSYKNMIFVDKNMIFMAIVKGKTPLSHEHESWS